MGKGIIRNGQPNLFLRGVDMEYLKIIDAASGTELCSFDAEDASEIFSTIHNQPDRLGGTVPVGQFPRPKDVAISAGQKLRLLFGFFDGTEKPFVVQVSNDIHFCVVPEEESQKMNALAAINHSISHNETVTIEASAEDRTILLNKCDQHLIDADGLERFSGSEAGRKWHIHMKGD